MRRAVKVITGITTAALIVMAGGLAAFGTAVVEFGKGADASAEGLVVLTGGEHRLAEASRLLVAGKGRRLLISGVNRQTSRDDIRRLSAIPAPLFDCCVDIGYAALDTVGNAEETRTWAAVWRFSHIGVVTSNYHMPRSLVELARAMPGVKLDAHGVPSRTVPAGDWWQTPNAARRVVTEYFKFLPAAARLAVTRAQDRVEQSILARAPNLNTGAAITLVPVPSGETGPANQGLGAPAKFR